ncbi:hypothetical protein JD969_11975 [Planctomycetota bacterium]|nr:hypothetical protein JD969_11975 [Planctomycetota bacterium]
MKRPQIYIYTIFALVLLLACSTLRASNLIQSKSNPNKTAQYNGHKYLVIFDKVLRPIKSSFIKEDVIKKTAEAKFNVYGLRIHHSIIGRTRNNLIKQTADYCQKYNISCMPIERGSFKVTVNEKNDGKCVTWKDGTTSPVLSPNLPEFWDKLESAIKPIAEASKTHSSIIGAFVDFENYYTDRRRLGDYYSVSYDPYSVNAFLVHIKQPQQKLNYNQTYPWIVENKLQQQFVDWQKKLWISKSKELRNNIDKINPNFRFFVYPGETTFFVDAIYSNWGTEKAPIILAHAGSTYRKTPFTPWHDTVNYCKKRIKFAKEKASKQHLKGQMLSAIYSSNKNLSEEGLGRIAQVIANQTDGYWFFYQDVEGSPYVHDKIMNAFTQANQAILSRNQPSVHTPLQQPDRWIIDIFTKYKKINAGNVPLKYIDNKPRDYSDINLIRANMLAVKAKKKDLIRLTINIDQSDETSSRADYQIIQNRTHKVIQTNSVNVPTHKIEFIAPEDGLYWIGLNTYFKRYRVMQANAPLALLAKGMSSTFFGDNSLYTFPLHERNEPFELEVMYQNQFKLNRLNVDGFAANITTMDNSNRLLRLTSAKPIFDLSKLIRVDFSGSQKPVYRVITTNNLIPFWFFKKEDAILPGD